MRWVPGCIGEAAVLIVDVRLPREPHPVVPVVVHADASATSTTTQRTPLERAYGERRARRTSREPAMLTECDLELIHAVTGERLWGAAPFDRDTLSGFAYQILADRRGGRLPAGREVSVDYLTSRGRSLTNQGALNPFIGAVLTRAVRFIESRGCGRVDLAL